MRLWRAVVFDLDDTLFAERDYVLSGFRAVSQWAADALGTNPASTFEELRNLHACGVRGTTFNAWLARHGLPAILVPELVSIYRAHKPLLRPFPGIVGLLTELADNVPLGIVTDG